MKKIAIMGLGALAACTAALTGCNKSGGEDFAANVDLVPVQVSQDKWSFVDADGNIKFEDEFKERPSLAYNGYFSKENNGKYDVYKLDGDKYKEVGDLAGLYSVGYYEEGLIPVSFPKERITVYDESGKKKFEVSPVNGKEVTETNAAYSDGLLVFELEDGKKGYLDKNGKVAIKATYDRAEDFSEGLAVVGVNDEEKNEMRYSVIDKKGETVFKIKDEQSPSDGFANGYLIVRDNERDVLYNTKGEVTRFPAKIKRISEVAGKNVVFTSEDNEMGVADMEGNIIIRPKYTQILSDGNDGFIAWDGDESLLLNAKGEQQQKLDYEMTLPYGKFGFFGKDGSRICQFDKEGKLKCKADFYDVNLFSRSASYGVRSDYFDTNGVATTIAGLVDGSKVGTYTLGAKASTVLAGESARDYGYRSQVSLDKLSSEGYRYEIKGQGLFTQTIATSDWNSYTYEYTYSWNPDSKLGLVLLEIDTRSEWGKSGYDALVSAFKSKGFSVAKEGYANDANAAMLTKGSVAVLLFAEPKSRDGLVYVMDKNLEEVSQFYTMMMDQISKEKSQSYKEAETAVENYEVEPDYYGEEAWVEVEETPAEAPADYAW